MTIRIVLDEQNFRDLVRGKVARVPEQRVSGAAGEDAAVILSDIGFTRLLFALGDAIREAELEREK